MNKLIFTLLITHSFNYADAPIVQPIIALGGNQSAGGTYALTSYLGSSVGGAAIGGNYSLVTGLPDDVLVVPPSPLITTIPTLLIQKTHSHVTITWAPAESGFVLETTDDLGHSLWAPVAGGNASPVAIGSDAAASFFRLRRSE